MTQLQYLCCLIASWFICGCAVYFISRTRDRAKSIERFDRIALILMVLALTTVLIVVFHPARQLLEWLR